MTHSKKLYLALLLMILVLFLTMFWYRSTFSMKRAGASYINKNSTRTFLIATQGSEFKDSLSSSLIDYYRNDSINIKLIDINTLDQVLAEDYAVILILHTWEMWKAPDVVVDFIRRSKKDSSRIVTFATSGDGNHKIKSVDGIAGASTKSMLPYYLEEIITKVDPILTPKK